MLKTNTGSRAHTAAVLLAVDLTGRGCHLPSRALVAACHPATRRLCVTVLPGMLCYAVQCCAAHTCRCGVRRKRVHQAVIGPDRGPVGEEACGSRLRSFVNQRAGGILGGVVVVVVCWAIST